MIRSYKLLVDCANCKHRFRGLGGMQCDLVPHAYQTDKQKDIVAWLCGDIQGACPSFKINQVGSYAR